MIWSIAGSAFDNKYIEKRKLNKSLFIHQTTICVFPSTDRSFVRAKPHKEALVFTKPKAKAKALLVYDNKTTNQYWITITKQNAKLQINNKITKRERIVSG